MLDLKAMRLSGSWVDLEPLDEKHREALRAVSVDERIWTYLPSNDAGAKFDCWFEKAIKGWQEGLQLPFAVINKADQKIIGTTRYYEIAPEHHRLSIGYTWYVQEVWGSAVNPECKLLLLDHAFETLGANRVAFYTDLRNARSCSAIKKLGAVEEGVLRKHMVLEDGHVRDTVVFSIISSEWSGIKTKLIERLATFKVR
ncbi:GNAT family N-acetyltransferase [Aquicella lusitana]|uniref:RimJ/RimL family protein N-acetyltransferase n=1 Tax=Aquicella lusitana TaxID=254246 RepID=A0A370GFE0_9COXI|nr:GNAT family protein [Aquicella lusitana]RDI42535.1 RimJ/RimL family protein N-acetyltransferase [Aquicella lusitana]VVC74314.1 Putative ribosomal N-acetyltransferase YdaF [Aquicella lusitana]